MTEKESVWEDLNIAEHRDEALAWAEDAFPQFSGNESLVAQLYFTNVLEKTLPPPVESITVAELQEKYKKFEPQILADGRKSKLYATLEVVVVQLLDDSRGYFGCPKCFNKVDRNVGYCSHSSHPGEEVVGENMTFQRWQAGDNTGNIILTFGPGNHQDIKTTQYYTLVVRGYVNERDGAFSVWEVVNKKAPKGLRKVKKLKKSRPNPEVVTVEDDETEFDDAEEATKAIFGEEESAEDEGAGGVVEDDDNEFGFKKNEEATLIRAFKKMLKRHYTKKTNSFENMLRWSVVQPQFRHHSKGKEREAIVRKWLKRMETNGMYEFTDAEETTVRSKLEG